MFWSILAAVALVYLHGEGEESISSAVVVDSVVAAVVVLAVAFVLVLLFVVVVVIQCARARSRFNTKRDSCSF